MSCLGVLVSDKKKQNLEESQLDLSVVEYALKVEARC